MGFPPIRARNDTWPLACPDSNSDIGLIHRRANRPVPEWLVASKGGTAEPVKMNWPLPEASSISRLATSHNTGASCHSSTSQGRSSYSWHATFAQVILLVVYFVP